MDMPKRYGHYSTAWRRLKRWEREGVWSKIVEALASKGCSMGKLKLDRVSVDSTTIEARKGELVGYDGCRRGKGSKIHAAVTAESLPLSVAVGPGDERDSVRFVEVIQEDNDKV
jgi:transposase